jgi:hypothetical protein
MLSQRRSGFIENRNWNTRCEGLSKKLKIKNKKPGVVNVLNQRHCCKWDERNYVMCVISKGRECRGNLGVIERAMGDHDCRTHFSMWWHIFRFSWGWTCLDLLKTQRFRICRRPVPGQGIGIGFAGMWGRQKWPRNKSSCVRRAHTIPNLPSRYENYLWSLRQVIQCLCNAFLPLGLYHRTKRIGFFWQSQICTSNYSCGTDSKTRRGLEMIILIIEKMKEKSGFLVVSLVNWWGWLLSIYCSFFGSSLAH